MNKDKVLGCLIGAAMGDAMGAATELRTIEQIKKDFGGWVTDFIKPPADTFGRCNEAAQCTDDFIQGYYILNEAILNKGIITEDVMVKAFRHWLDYPYYLNFTGPTTRAAMQKLFNDKRMSLQGAVEASSQPSDVILINNGNVAATNGAAMKIWVSVLLTKELSYEEKEEQLLANVYSVCKLTHNNVLSVSGAAAVAFAISTALDENCSFADIFTAAIDGAEKGYSYAFKRGAMMVAGASVAERIKLAVSIGNSYNDWSEAVKPLSDIIGSGLQANEAVPVTFGLLASCRKKPLDAILGGVNIGNDTDTVATMAGAIAGAFSGAMAFDRNDIEKLESANGFSFHKMVAELASIPG